MTLGMNPRNRRGQVWLYLKHKVIELNSKILPLTNYHKLSVKDRLVAKKRPKSSQNQHRDDHREYHPKQPS